MISRHIYLLIYIVFCGLSTGCATVTKGTSQSLSVDSDPQGATCELTRDGETIGFVNPTPGSITIGKDKDAIDIRCELEGHVVSTVNLDSSFQGWTLGNAILGGLIGVMIDAGSGAMNEYPSSIMIRLVPESFSTAEERDSYYNELKQELSDKYNNLAESKRYNCSTKSCEKNMEKLNKEREAEEAKLEDQRLASVVEECTSTAC